MAGVSPALLNIAADTAATTASDVSKEFLRPLKKAFSEGRVFLAAQFGELLQFCALLSVEARRHFNHYAHEQVAAFAPIDVNDAFAAKLKHLTALRARGNFQVRFAFQCRHGNFAAERGQRKRNRHFTIQVVLVALKNFVLLDVDDNIEIALRTAANTSFAVAG